MLRHVGQAGLGAAPLSLRAAGTGAGGLELDDIKTEEADATRLPWQTLVLPALREMPRAEVVGAAGMSARNAHTVPRDRNREILAQTASKYAREQLQERGVEPPADDLATCAAYLALKTS